MKEVIMSLILVKIFNRIAKKPTAINPKINSRLLKLLISLIFKLDKFKKSLPNPDMLINTTQIMIENKIKVVNKFL